MGNQKEGSQEEGNWVIREIEGARVERREWVGPARIGDAGQTPLNPPVAKCSDRGKFGLPWLNNR